MTVNILFPAHPNSKNTITPFWETEYHAAKEAGFDVNLVSDPNDKGAVSITGKGDINIYRGWIIKPPYYKDMEKATGKKLLTSYDDYMWSFDFPKWYFDLGGSSSEYTMPSITFTAEQVRIFGLEGIAKRVASERGSVPMIIKDYLKSRKHEWFDACFIKDVSDQTESIRVMTNFFQLQGRDFYGGLVFRDFIPFKKAGEHPKTKMPLAVEFRTFFVHQLPMMTMTYWSDDIEYNTNIESPPEEWLKEVGKKMKSPLVALDIAQSESGKWYVIEVNDFQTAGYPKYIDSKEFYSLLLKGL